MAARDQFGLTVRRRRLQCGRIPHQPRNAIMNHKDNAAAIPSCPSRLPSHRKWRTSLVRSFPAGLVIVVLLSLASSIAAQETRWSELIKQARALRSQGKYAESIPVAEKAVQEAEQTF